MERNDAGAPEFEVSSLDHATPEQARRSAALRWLRSRPGRLALSALTLLIVLGALAGMLVRATPDPIGEIGFAFGGPTPTATPFIPPGGDEFGLENWVPWGDLRIDGYTPAFTAITPIGQGFILPRGVHQLTYEARYFTTLRCVITVPQSLDDTCPLGNSAGSAGDTFQRILDLQATPAKMPFDQYKLLLDSVDSVVSGYSATTTIQPGERFINQSGQIEDAHVAMTFTLGVSQIQKQPDTICPLLCPDVVASPDAQGPWYLNALVSPTWTVKDPSGRSSFPLLTTQEAPSPITLVVTLGDAGWSIQVQDQSVLASIVQNVAGLAVSDELRSIPNNAGVNLDISSGANPADGAVIVINDTQGGKHIVLLWRFGLVYTVNAEAARLFPKLPLASKQEQTLAQTMVAGIQS